MFCDEDCDCEQCLDEDEEFCQWIPSQYSQRCPDGFLELEGEFDTTEPITL